MPRTLVARLVPFLEEAARRLGVGDTVSVVLVTDERIQALHRDFMGIDEPTDVLTFPAQGGEAGDVILSYDRAVAQAGGYGVSAAEEVARLAVHGLLHLAGYDDAEADQRQRMWEVQEGLIGELWS